MGRGEDGGTEIAGIFELDMWDDGYPGIDPTDNAYGLSTLREVIGITASGSMKIWMPGSMKSIRWMKRTKEAACEVAAILEEELPQILLFSTLEMHGLSNGYKAFTSANDPVTWNVADWTVTE